MFSLRFVQGFEKPQQHRVINYLSIYGLNQFFSSLLSYFHAQTLCFDVCYSFDPEACFRSERFHSREAIMGFFTFAASNVNFCKKKCTFQDILGYHMHRILVNASFMLKNVYNCLRDFKAERNATAPKSFDSLIIAVTPHDIDLNSNDGFVKTKFVRHLAIGPLQDVLE